MARESLFEYLFRNRDITKLSRNRAIPRDMLDDILRKNKLFIPDIHGVLINVRFGLRMPTR